WREVAPDDAMHSGYLADVFHVDTDLAATGERDQRQLVGMRHAEAQVRHMTGVEMRLAIRGGGQGDLVGRNVEMRRQNRPERRATRGKTAAVTFEAVAADTLDLVLREERLHRDDVERHAPDEHALAWKRLVRAEVAPIPYDRCHPPNRVVG